MNILLELLNAGQRHYQTNKRIGQTVGVLAVISIIGALVTTNTVRWVFVIAALVFLVTSGIALIQHRKLKDHDMKLRAAIPYAKNEQFDETVIRLRDTVDAFEEDTDPETFMRTYDEVKEYTALLKDRVVPLSEKGESNLTYDERIIYTLNIKALTQLQPSLDKLDKLRTIHDKLTILSDK